MNENTTENEDIKECTYKDYFDVIYELQNLNDEHIIVPASFRNFIVYLYKTFIKNKVDYLYFKNSYKEAYAEFENELNKVTSYKTANKLQKYYYRNRNIFNNAPKVSDFDDSYDETLDKYKVYKVDGDDVHLINNTDIIIINNNYDIMNKLIDVYRNSSNVKYQMYVEERRIQKRLNKLKHKDENNNE